MVENEPSKMHANVRPASRGRRVVQFRTGDFDELHVFVARDQERFESEAAHVVHGLLAPEVCLELVRELLVAEECGGRESQCEVGRTAVPDDEQFIPKW